MYCKQIFDMSLIKTHYDTFQGVVHIYTISPLDLILYARVGVVIFTFFPQDFVLNLLAATAITNICLLAV